MLDKICSLTINIYEQTGHSQKKKLGILLCIKDNHEASSWTDEVELEMGLSVE